MTPISSIENVNGKWVRPHSWNCFCGNGGKVHFSDFFINPLKHPKNKKAAGFSGGF